MIVYRFTERSVCDSLRKVAGEQSGHPPNILSEDKKAALGANLGRRVCT